MFISVNYASNYLVGDRGTAANEAESFCDRIIMNLNRFVLAGDLFGDHPFNISYPPDMYTYVCVSGGKKDKFFEEFCYVINGCSLVAFVGNSVTQNTLEGVRFLVRLFLSICLLATENQSDCSRN